MTNTPLWQQETETMFPSRRPPRTCSHGSHLLTPVHASNMSNSTCRSNMSNVASTCRMSNDTSCLLPFDMLLRHVAGLDGALSCYLPQFWVRASVKENTRISKLLRGLYSTDSRGVSYIPDRFDSTMIRGCHCFCS